MAAFTRVSPCVVRIMGQNPGPMTLEGTNTYLVGTGLQRILVDTGEGRTGYADALASALDDASLQLGAPVSIRHVLLTHGHPDHVGGLDQVRRIAPHVQIYKAPSSSLSPPAGPTLAPPPPQIDVPGAHLSIFPIPGHTDDHVCALLEEEAAIFTGDTVLGIGSSVFSCYTDYMASLAYLKTLAPARLYPAHGPVVDNGRSRVEEMIHHREQREHQIVTALDSCRAPLPTAGGDVTDAAPAGMSVEELVASLYKDVDRRLWGAAGVNVFHHLKKLIREGRAVVVQPPQSTLDMDVLSDENDYRLFGEGMSMDVEAMTQIFRTFRVGLSS